MLYRIENEYLSVTVCDRGAELYSIKAADGTEYLWQGEERYWTGRAPNLFPFVARLNGGRYTMDGEEYAMGIHGFAKNSLFSVSEGGGRLLFTLCDSAESYAQYPRRFCLSIIYELHGRRLDIRFKVDNRDDRTMYFGIGGHPGFNVPLKPELDFSDYSIRFDKPCRPQRVLFSDRLLVTGETRPFELEDGRSIPLRHDLFDHDAVVLRDMERRLTIGTDRDSHAVTVGFPQTPNVGFWHMRGTDAPYVCVEPWASLPAAEGVPTCFEQEEDLIRLAPGGSYVNDWYIEIAF